MKKTELLAAMEKSRAELDAALAGLTPEQLVDPGALGDWSVKDILSHLTACEAEVVTLLAKTKQGKTYPVAHTDEEIEAQNARWHKENKDRPLERATADHAGVRKQMLRQLEGYTDAELNIPRPVLKKRALMEWVQSDTVEHESEHAAHIAQWRKNKLGA